MAAVTLAGVRKLFGSTEVLHGVDVAVDDGEFCVLVGPSGCGKSTLLRMIAGLEEISDGVVTIGGRTVNTMPPKERDIAMVFQNYALYPHMTVLDNMAFSLKLRRADKAVIDQRVKQAAEILGLNDYLKRYPRQLSGGQRQRVAMGRAIVRDPRAFLMDEPLSNLDAKLRVQMRAEIAQLQRALGTTTIYVTHDQTEAMTLGSRVAVISGGVLQQVAAPQELYRRPANLFVAGFIGSPPMNLIDARLEHGPVVAFGPHRLAVPPEVVREHPALERHLGGEVVLGIRPEHLHDAALIHDRGSWPVIELPIRLREELGSEVQLHGAIGSAAHVSEDGGADDVRSLATIVAKADPRTKIAEGETAALAVDAAEMQFFDRATGASIRR